MRLFQLTVFGIFSCETVLGQIQKTAIEDVSIYVKKIDSLRDATILVATNSPGFVTSIAEGIIEHTKRKLRGGFSTEITSDTTGKILYVIRNSDNLQKNLYKSYYFKSDKLVFSEIKLTDDDGLSDVLFLRRDIYHDDEVIYSTTDASHLKAKYRWRIDFDPLTDGYSYLRQFRSEQQK